MAVALERFYVTVIDDGRVGRLAGPFPSYFMAAEYVDPARREACAIDPWAAFYAFGVSKWASTDPQPGRLNARLGLS